MFVLLAQVVSVGDDVKIDGLTSGVKLLVKGYGGTPVSLFLPSTMCRAIVLGIRNLSAKVACGF